MRRPGQEPSGRARAVDAIVLIISSTSSQVDIARERRTGRSVTQCQARVRSTMKISTSILCV